MHVKCTRDIDKKRQMEIFFSTNFEKFEMTTMVKSKNWETFVSVPCKQKYYFS